MIDEKKIEEAAIDASIKDTNKGIVRDDYVISAKADHELGFQDGFKTGINWFLDNLWHDASEEPPYYKKVLVYFKHKCPRLESFNGLCDYDRMCKAWEITRWLDIADLLKGGK